MKSPKRKAAKKKAPRKAPRKAPVKRAPQVKKVAGPYVATLTANEETSTAHGATAYEAMAGLATKNIFLKTRAELSLSFGGKSSTQMFMSVQLRRFLNSKVCREMWAKRLELKLE